MAQRKIGDFGGLPDSFCESWITLAPCSFLIFLLCVCFHFSYFIFVCLRASSLPMKINKQK